MDVRPQRADLKLRVLLLAALAGSATPTRAASLELDAGIGHESQSSPLVQITPQSTIVYLDGLQRLRGTHAKAALRGSWDWAWPSGLGASVSADVGTKRSPGSPDLNMASASVQPSVHYPTAWGSVGAGLSLQRFDVANEHFRTARSMQFTWTRPDGPHLWSAVLETGTLRHPTTLVELNAQSRSVVLLRQIQQPVPGVDGLDLSLVTSRERNQRGLAELSNRSTLLYASVRWSALGAAWTAGLGQRRDRFDDIAFADEPARRDRSRLLDLAAQWPLTDQVSMRVELNTARNASSTRLYDNRYQQFSLFLRTGW